MVLTLSSLEEPAATDRTMLALEHRFDAQIPGPYGDELVDDLWRLTLGNLDAHLRGGDGVVLPDYSDPSPEIRLSIVIDAPPERVFKALVDPAAPSKSRPATWDSTHRPAGKGAKCVETEGTLRNRIRHRV